MLISKFHTIRAKMSSISAHASSLPMHRRGPRPKDCMAAGLWLMIAAGREGGGSQRSGMKVSGWENWAGENWRVKEATETSVWNM